LHRVTVKVLLSTPIAGALNETTILLFRGAGLFPTGETLTTAKRSCPGVGGGSHTVCEGSQPPPSPPPPPSTPELLSLVRTNDAMAYDCMMMTSPMTPLLSILFALSTFWVSPPAVIHWYPAYSTMHTATTPSAVSSPLMMRLTVGMSPPWANPSTLAEPIPK